jgi:DNA-binding YbaB/EbfC family protein
MAKGKGARGAGTGMASQIGRLQEQLMQAQAALAEETVEASAGGGAIRVVMSGTQECKAVQIAPRLLSEGDAEMLQDLLMIAVNQAIAESRELAAKRLGPLAGGMGLGG